jgi:hypothetical protein
MKSGALSKSILDEYDFVPYKVPTSFEINEAYFVVYGYDKNTNIVFLTTRVSDALYERIMDNKIYIVNAKINGYAIYCISCGLDSQHYYCHYCYEIIKRKMFVNSGCIPVIFESCEYISYINTMTIYEKKILIGLSEEKIIGVIHIDHILWDSPMITHMNFVISKVDRIPYKIPIKARVEYNMRKYTHHWLLMREFILADLRVPIVCMMICE